MEYDPEEQLTVKKFIDDLLEMNKEIYCDGEKIASHKIKSKVRFKDTEGNYYNLVALDADQLWGCGCWCGIYVVLEKEPEDE